MPAWPDRRRSRAASFALTRVVVSLVLLGGFVGAVARAGDEVPAPRPTLVPQPGLVRPLACAAISPNGRLVVTGSADHWASLWEVSTESLLRTLDGHGDALTCVTFSPDGRLILTGSTDGTARLWRPEMGREIASFQEDWTEITAVAFSHGGTFVLAGTQSGSVHLWRISDGRLVRTWKGHEGAVVSLALSPSPDGRWLVTASADGSARIWDVRGAGPSRHVLSASAGPLRRAAFAPDGRHVITQAASGDLRLWRSRDGRMVRHVPTVAVEGAPGQRRPAALLTPDGKLVLASGDESAGLASLAGEDPPLSLQPDALRGTPGAALSGSGGALLLWDAEGFTIHPRSELPDPSGHGVSLHSWTSPGPAVAFASTSGRRLLVSHQHERPHAVLWDLARGRPLIHRLRSEWVTRPTLRWAHQALALSPDGRWGLFTVPENDRYVGRCIDLDTDEEVSAFVGHEEVIQCGAFSPAGDFVATGDGADLVHLWDPTSGRRIRTLSGHSGGVLCLTVSPDGKHLLTASGDGTIRLWSSNHGSPRSVVRGRSGVTVVAFHPDGERVLVGYADGVLELRSGDLQTPSWEVSDGRVGVWSACFFPDGERILASHWDHTACVRNVKDGSVRVELPRHRGPIWSSVVCAGGTRVVTGGDDGILRAFDAEDGRSLCSFRASDEAWMAWDDEGRFDTTREMGGRSLRWTQGLESDALFRESLWERCHEDGLLGRRMGFVAGPPRPEPRLDEHRRAPHLDVEVAETGRLAIRLRDLGGGIGRVVVRDSGGEIVADVGGEALAGEEPVVYVPSASLPGSLLSAVVVAWSDDGKNATTRSVVVDTRRREPTGFDPERPHLLPGHVVHRRYDDQKGAAPVTSADGHWGVVPDPQGPARVLDCRTGTVVRRLGSGCPHAVSAAISRDGRWVAVNEGESIKVWDWRAGEIRSEPSCARAITALAFLKHPPRLAWVEIPSPWATDEASRRAVPTLHVATLDDDGGLSSPPEVRPLPRTVHYLDVFPRGEGGIGLLTLSDEGVVSILDAGSLAMRTVWTDRVGLPVRRSADMEPPAHRARGRVVGDVVVLSAPGVREAWHLPTGRRLLETPSGDSENGLVATDGRTHVAFTRDPATPTSEERESTGGSPGALIVRDLDTGRTVLEHALAMPAADLSFGGDGTRVYVVTGDTLTEFELREGASREIGAPAPHDVVFGEGLFLPAARGRGRALTLVRAELRMDRGKQPVPCVVWSLETGRPMASGVLPPDAEVEYVFSSESTVNLKDGPRRSVNGDLEARLVKDGGLLRLRSTRSGTEPLLEKSGVTSFAFDPSGTHLVYVEGRDIVTWDVASKKETRRTRLPHHLLDRIRRVTAGAEYVLLEGAEYQQEGGRVTTVPAPTLVDLERQRLVPVTSPLARILDVSLDGHTVLVEEPSRCLVRDLDSDTIRAELPPVGYAELSGDGRCVVASTPSTDMFDRDLVLYDGSTGRLVARWEPDTDP